MANNLALFGNKALRSAIQANLVSFPAQAPIFGKDRPGDVQWRAAQLYFVAGWSVRSIGQRFRLTDDTVRKMLGDWRLRAITSGYIQEIGTEVAITAEMLAPQSDNSPAEEHSSNSLQLVKTRTAESRVRAVPFRSSDNPPSADVVMMILSEIQTGVSEHGVWLPFCRRLIQILKREFIERGLEYSLAQVSRIETITEIDPLTTADLLDDLTNRVRDEQEYAPAQTDAGRAVIVGSLLAEIEAGIRESAGWPPHCTRLLEIVRRACWTLGMAFSLRQIDRLFNAISSEPAQVSSLFRDLRNRLADELDRAALVRLPDQVPRQMTAGYGR
jgi:hypothetical protein